MIHLIMHPGILPVVLPSIITAEDMQASTGRCQKKYTSNMDCKRKHGETIITSEQKNKSQMQKPEWPAHKIVSLAVKGYENIFCHRTGEIAFYSTYFRMIVF